MKPVFLAVATLSLSALSFSQLGTPPTGSPQPLVASPGTVVGVMSEGYFVRNGTSYFTRNGNVFRVEREVSLKVLPNGMVGFDGQPLLLPVGVMLAPDGRHIPIPAGLNVPSLPGVGITGPISPVEAGTPVPPVTAPPVPQPVATDAPSATGVPR
jgi:hypothetical protein